LKSVCGMVMTIDIVCLVFSMHSRQLIASVEQTNNENTKRRNQA
jgi:hypothetical protein